MRFYIKARNVHFRIIDRLKAVPMKRNQIIDTVYLIQREVWVDSVGIRGMRNEPSTTYPALEFITVKSVCAIHDKLKVVECALLSVDCRSYCVIRIGFVKPRKYALLFRSFEVEFPSLFGIGRFSLVFCGTFSHLQKVSAVKPM